MTNMALSDAPNKQLMGILLFAMVLSHSTACPDTCFCMDAFVTCSDFTSLDMTTLPEGTDTLILNRGEMQEIPPGFLAKAKHLKLLEMNFINAKVIRRSAFTDLKDLDLFSITSSAFDIVESESFSGWTEISKFHISDSKFGTVNKHAFADMKNIADLRIWSSTFDVISDETFYKLSEIVSFQLYQNNITSLGSKLFLESSFIDDITIYKNKILKISAESFQNINDVASRMVLHANVFICSCDIVWILVNQDFKDYLASNDCIFPDHTGKEISIFRMSDVTKEALCPGMSTDVTDSTAGDIAVTVKDVTDFFLPTDDYEDFTNDNFFISSFSPRFVPSTSVASKRSTTSTEVSQTSTEQPTVSTQKSTKQPKSSTTLSVDASSTTLSVDASSTSRLLVTSPTTERSGQSSPQNVPIVSSTDTQFSNDTSYPEHLTSPSHTPAQATESLTKNENTPDFLKEVTPKGWTAPIPQASIDVDKGEPAQPYSTSAIDMATSIPDTASNVSHGNWLFIAVLSGLTWFLVISP